MAFEGESIPVEVVRRMLVAFGADVNDENQQFSVGFHADAQQPTLYKAVQDGDAPLVEALLAVGVEMDVKLALDLAAFHGRIDVVRDLLAAGANPDGDGEWKTPLDLAAGQGHVDVMKVLVEAGADASSFLSMREAVRGGNPAAIQVLLDAGAAVNSICFLCKAVEYGQRNCLGPLLRAGAPFVTSSRKDYRCCCFSEQFSWSSGSPKRRPNSTSAFRYLERVQDAGGYDQLVQKYRRVLTAPQSCLSRYLRFHCEIRFSLGAFPTDLVALVLEFWKPPGGP